jgi:predicted TIM-barrel fold metal-dependent hydrolase
MKIIDAHIHYTQNEYFEYTALNSGGKNSFAYLKDEFKKNNIVLGIGMGNVVNEDAPSGYPSLLNLDFPLDVNNYNYPDFTAFCIGINPRGLNKLNAHKVICEYEKILKTKRAVGLKVYAGYHECYVYDEMYHPFYDLAAQYDVPVVIHTGDTAGGRGRLKYAHPLTVDEAASEFPNTNFVIAHYGNPWIVDATQVAAKNQNVYIELSGMIAGDFDVDKLCADQSGFVNHLKTWIQYIDRYDKFLYGSDWPLVNMEKYIEFIKRIIPENKFELVFFKNASNIFKKINTFM